VSFETGDLLLSRIPREAYDLVLCRNTVIYFNEPVRDALHERLVSSLRPGGVLMIGSTERVTKPRELGLQPTHPFVYRKADS
jgi:chemotaxis protein methyltransferase CheR